MGGVEFPRAFTGIPRSADVALPIYFFNFLQLFFPAFAHSVGQFHQCSQPNNQNCNDQNRLSNYDDF